MTHYDDLFQAFIDNCGIDTSRLPTDSEKLYEMIKNSARHYNVYLKDEGIVVCNDDEETINKELDDIRLLIFAYCMKYVYLENQLVGFQELWSPFQNDFGIRNYKSQVDGRENTLERTKQKIVELVTSIEDVDFM